MDITGNKRPRQQFYRGAQHWNEQDSKTTKKRNAEFIRGFRDLNSQLSSVEWFKGQWCSIDKYNTLDARDLSFVLHYTSDFIRKRLLDGTEPKNQKMALGCLKIVHENWDRWEFPVRKVLKTATPETLGFVLYNAVSLRIRPSPEFLQKWEDRVRKTLGQFDEKSISFSLRALKRLEDLFGDGDNLRNVACKIYEQIPPGNFMGFREESRRYIRQAADHFGFNAPPVSSRSFTGGMSSSDLVYS